MRAELFRRLAVLNAQRSRCPRSAQLIRSRHNVIVFAQKDDERPLPVEPGRVRNLDPGHTARRGRSPAQFTCERCSRGARRQPAADDEQLGRHLPAAPQAERPAPRARSSSSALAQCIQRPRPDPEPDPDRLLQPRRRDRRRQQAQRRHRSSRPAEPRRRGRSTRRWSRRRPARRAPACSRAASP